MSDTSQDRTDLLAISTWACTLVEAAEYQVARIEAIQMRAGINGMLTADSTERRLGRHLRLLKPHIRGIQDEANHTLRLLKLMKAAADLDAENEPDAEDEGDPPDDGNPKPPPYQIDGLHAPWGNLEEDDDA